MNTLDDRRRSIRQHIGYGMQALAQYDLHTQRTQIVDDARPAGLVEASAPVVPLGNPRTAIPAGDVQQQQTFAMMLYPPLGAAPRESRLIADQHAQRLDDIITLGLVDDEDPPNSICAPFQIPLYDHEGVAVVGPDRADVPAQPYAFATVEQWQVQPIQDPLDELRWTVASTLRISWWRSGRIEPEGEIVQSVPGTWDNPPQGP